MHLKTLAAALFILATFCFAPAPLYAQKKAQQGNQQITDEIFRLVNKHREGKGLKPLRQNAIIAKVAEGHSRNMAGKSVAFGHDGFEGRVAKIEKQLKPAMASAENVAFSTRDAKGVVDMWLHSKGHRENIEGGYSLTGIGMAKGADGQYYYTQIFIKD